MKNFCKSFLRLLSVSFLVFAVFYTQANADNQLSDLEKAEGWQLLFNGKDLKGWKASENQGSFKVENGAIKVHGKRSHLFYIGKVNEAKFKDFIYRVKVKTQKHANSGLYFHTRYQDEGWPKVGYEAQVNNTGRDWRKTASIYAVSDVKDVVVKDDEWFDYEIVVKDKRIITRINGQTMVDYTEPENVNIKNWPDKKLGMGTFAIQAHDPQSVVYVKDIKVLPLYVNAEAKVAAKKKQRMPWYDKADFGPFLHTTVGSSNGEVRKGLVIRVGNMQNYSVLFDTETLQFNGAWEGYLHMNGTPWNGRHGGNPMWKGSNEFYMNKPGPGWTYKGSFKDPRSNGDGPLPRKWAKYKGLYRDGQNIVVKYSVGSSMVLDKPAIETKNNILALSRSIEIDKVDSELTMLVSDETKFKLNLVQDQAWVGEVLPQPHSTAMLIGAPKGVRLAREKGKIVLKVAPSSKPLRFKLLVAKNVTDKNLKTLASFPKAGALDVHTKGGPSLWKTTVKLKGTMGKAKAGQPYVVDQIALPMNNPYQQNFRSGGFDFFSDGKRAIFCTWNGDVWMCSGIEGDLQNLVWKRYAAGLFETLGVKIVDDIVYITGKDQVTRLHDLNQDGEADFYECFNNDIHITNNFHEFTFDLQTDQEGNFYLAKGSPVLGGGRGFDRSTKHNGTVVKISKDGSKMETFSTGLRAPGGVGVGPNGEVTTGENEGTYIPRCKLNWCEPGSFHGVVPSEWRGRRFVKTLPGAPTTFAQPLCWFPMSVDNSGGNQVWTPNSKWGLPKHTLLHCSYGKSSIYRVMYEKVNGQIQGGVYRLPIKLRSSAMRARFNPVDEQLYVIGFKGWQTNAASSCAFQRVRYTGAAIIAPSALNVKPNGIQLSFTSELDAELAEDPESYNISMWNYVWGPMYGSGEFSVLKPNKELMTKALSQETGRYKAHDNIKVKSAKLSKDKKSVFLEIAEIQPVHQMKIELDLETVDGDEIPVTIYNTINRVGDKSISWFKK